MYSQMLVPLDGSEFSERVLPYARLLAKGLGCPIELLRVMDPVVENRADSAHGLYPHRVAESEKSHLEDYLNEQSRTLRAEGLKVSTAVHEGNPASEIISEAETHENGLIAMATHGRSGITRWLMGSVANKVLQGSSAPLLLVRSGQQSGVDEELILKTVIVPLDRSPMAEQALSHAAALAKALNLRVALVWVFPMIEGHYTDIGYGGTTYGVAPFGEISREVETEARKYFVGVQEDLQNQGISDVEVHLLWGHAAGSIVDLARDTPNSLVVLTTHGFSGPSRWIMGSVADQIVRQAGEPVLLIRASGLPGNG
ncbi:MAG: universal stress protein [Chloroflexi bacterium]|nr:universal stress protein [Chloroflexota bacterium]